MATHRFPPGNLFGMREGMELQHAKLEGCPILRLSGEIDLAASPVLRAELQRICQERTPELLLDFSEVEYIDSSGLATLIEYLRDAGQHGGRLALFGLQPKVQMVFNLVRLNELFTIAEDAPTARARLQQA